jgi:hypothetical protein
MGAWAATIDDKSEATGTTLIQRIIKKSIQASIHRVGGGRSERAMRFALMEQPVLEAMVFFGTVILPIRLAVFLRLEGRYTSFTFKQRL